MEVGAVSGEEAWVVNASDRGYDAYPPGNYYASVGNNIHHNTVIWDGNANGTAGFMQSDAANQPHFFVNNIPPDFNSYHLANASTANFVYDDNDSQNNSRVGFLQFQSNGADVDGTVDTNYAGGFPSVAITSPADESGFAGSLTVLASASDPSGIGKVEFYVDWTLQSTATSPPYQFNWTNGTSGAHTIAAMAYSGAGVRACSAVNVTKQ
jgi:Bacterial Ig domain